MPIQAQSAGSRALDTALWAASAALLGLSLILSWGPPPEIGPDFDWADKAWHFLGYGALTGSLLLAAVWRPGRGAGRFPRASLWVAGLVLALAWLTEALQAPFGRDADLFDAAVDALGMAVGWIAWALLKRPELGRAR